MPWEISPGVSIGPDERSPGSGFANEPRPFAGVQCEIPAMAYSLKAEFARRERRAESDLLLFVLDARFRFESGLVRRGSSFVCLYSLVSEKFM